MQVNKFLQFYYLSLHASKPDLYSDTQKKQYLKTGDFNYERNGAE